MLIFFIQTLCGVLILRRLQATMPPPPTPTTLTPKPLNNVSCGLTVNLLRTKGLMKHGLFDQDRFLLSPTQ